MRKMLNFKGPPPEVEPSQAAAYDDISIFATIQADNAPSGIGGILRPRQEAVGISPEALRTEGEAQPPHVFHVKLKLH